MRRGERETIYSHLLYLTWPELFYEMKRRGKNDVADKRTWWFAVQHPSYSPRSNAYTCRHRDATMTSQLVIRARILPESKYRVIRTLTEPKVIRRKRRYLNCGNSIPKESPRYRRSRTMDGKFRDNFYSQNGSCLLPTISTTPKRLRKFSYPYEANSQVYIAAVIGLQTLRA